MFCQLTILTIFNNCQLFLRALCDLDWIIILNEGCYVKYVLVQKMFLRIWFFYRSMSAEPDARSSKVVSEIVDEKINSFKYLKALFVCPIDNCSKPCLGLLTLKHYLQNVHNDRLSQVKHIEEDGALQTIRMRKKSITNSTR